MSRVLVLGAGAWGTALALTLHRRLGRHITLWAHSHEFARQLLDAGENTQFLPGFPIPPDLTVTGDCAAASDAEIVVSVIPSEFLRSAFARFSSHLQTGQILLSATKGLENPTLLRMTEVIAACLSQQQPCQDMTGRPPGEAEEEPDVLKGHDFSRTERATKAMGALAPEAHLSLTPPAPLTPPTSPAPLTPLAALSLPIGALSGPSFALEVAQAQPTALTVAFHDAAIAARIQREFSSETLRLYTSTDVIGVELGGALKNVIAIAAGVAVGVGLGHNSIAALITRGIAEITRLAVACGARRETLAGLSGMGDLVLTCTGSLSRNRTLGQALGQGRKLPEILDSLGGRVAEGVLTTRAALGLARKHSIEMPITEQMELILNEGKDPRQAIRTLMLRPGKEEHSTE